MKALPFSSLFVGVFFSLFQLSVFAQNPLPMKDLTVGNRFIYLVSGSPLGKFLFYEEVQRDTIIRGLKYGIVFNSFDKGSRLERSNDSTIVVYNTQSQKEEIVHCMKGGCHIAPWLIFGGIENSNLYNTIGDSAARVGKIEGADYVPPALPVGFSASQTILLFDYVKPFGVKNITYAYRYSSNPRSSPFNRHPVPVYIMIDNSVEIVGALIQGQVFGDTTSHDKYMLSLTMLSALQFGQVSEIPLRLSAVPGFGNLEAVTLASCRIEIDTNLLELIAVRANDSSAGGAIQPDSIQKIGNRMAIFCSIRLPSLPLDGNISFLRVRSCAIKDTTTSISINSISSVPAYPIPATSAQIRFIPRLLSIRTDALFLTFGVEKTSAISLTQGQSNKEVTDVFPLRGLQQFSFAVIVDTSLLEIPKIFSATQQLRLFPQTTRALPNNRLELGFTIPGSSLSGNRIAMMSSKSKAPVYTSSLTAIQFTTATVLKGYEFTASANTWTTFIPRRLHLRLSTTELPLGVSEIPIRLFENDSAINEKLSPLTSLDVEFTLSTRFFDASALQFFSQQHRAIPIASRRISKDTLFARLVFPLQDTIRNGVIGSMKVRTNAGIEEKTTTPISSVLYSVQPGFEFYRNYQACTIKANLSNLELQFLQSRSNLFSLRSQNPVSEQIMVRAAIGTGIGFEAHLYNTFGNMVVGTDSRYYSPGVYEFPISVLNLPNGAYTLVLKTMFGTETHRIMVIH